MAYQLNWAPGRRTLGQSPLPAVLVAVGFVAASIVIARALQMYGMPVFIGAVALALVAWAVVAPRSHVFFLLAAMIIVEPDAFDLTAPLSAALYGFPESVQAELPLTVAPLEVLGALALASILARDNAGRGARWRRVPILTAAVPMVIAAGLAYGYIKGADLALAYHEVRGLLFAIVAFALAVELSATHRDTAIRVVTWGTAVAAVVLIARYFFLLRGGDSGVAKEFAYAHESVLFLACGIALSASLWMSRQSGTSRWLLLLHAALLLAAILVTGRRSGTLVVMVVAVVMLAMLIRRRPLAATSIGLIGMACFGVYMGAYWNQEYGALAQPARAIRSQFDPTARDASSDTYRLVERSSILATLDSNPVFGVGFGNPFFTTGALPELRRFWPLQYYTTHQNVLWLWMKMGLMGISTILGVWLIASGRAVRAFWTAPRDGPFPVLPLVLMSTFGAYLFFASVDITFSHTRAVVPLGIALAVALVNLPPWTSRTPVEEGPST